MFLILLLGTPGTGKGSLAHLLVREFGFIHFSTGKIFRALKDKNTAEGSLVSDDQVNSLVLKEFAAMRDQNPDMKVVLDGFPRTRVQAEFFKQHFHINKVFLLGNISDEFIIQRLSNRLLCEKSDHAFNSETFPPKVEGICDYDGSKLYRRTDDVPEIVAKRLRVYRQSTQPLIDYYRNIGDLYELDASAGVKNMFNEVKKHINGFI